MRSLPILLLLASASANAALPGSEAVVLTGSFVPTMPVPALPHAESVQGTAYGEWPNRAIASGHAITGVFLTPSAVEFDIAGDPKMPGMRMALQDAANPAQTLELNVDRNSAAAWLTRRWSVPREWQHRQVRLIVEDQGTTVGGRWVAFTLPREAHVFSIDSFIYAAYLLINLIAEWAVLLVPGLAITLWFSRKRVLDSPLTIIVTLTGCGIGGLLCFFCYVLAHRLGLLVSLGILAASAIVAILYRRRLGPMLRRPVLQVLVSWLLCAALYTSAGLLYRNDSPVNENIQDRFFTYAMPPDNILPLILGEKIFNQAPYRPAFFGDIQSSDRPPLQTGIMLLQRPFWREPELQYLLLGILLQTSWIPALWVLLRRMGVTGPPLLAAIAIPALSQFAFVHEVFVWPKLLSAAFGLLAISCFGWFTDRESTLADALLGGALTALAMLSHGGVTMTVIAFALVTALARKAPLRWSVTLIGAAAVVYLPWVLYQKLYDPPGDALLKLHLAGVIDRNHSLGSLVVSSYRKLGFSGWLQARWTNTRFLFWPTSEVTQFHDLGQTAYWLSHLSFFNLFPALGFANAGFLLRFGSARAERRVADRMMLIAFASLVVWLLIMFAPESTSIHQGSFLMVILTFTALALYSMRFAAALVSLQLAEFLLLVLFAKPLMSRQANTITDTFPDVGMFTLFALALTALAIWFWKEWRKGGPLSN